MGGLLREEASVPQLCSQCAGWQGVLCPACVRIRAPGWQRLRAPGGVYGVVLGAQGAHNSTRGPWRLQPAVTHCATVHHARWAGVGLRRAACWSRPVQHACATATRPCARGVLAPVSASAHHNHQAQHTRTPGPEAHRHTQTHTDTHASTQLSARFARRHTLLRHTVPDSWLRQRLSAVSQALE